MSTNTKGRWNLEGGYREDRRDGVDSMNYVCSNGVIAVICIDSCRWHVVFMIARRLCVSVGSVHVVCDGVVWNCVCFPQCSSCTCLL